MIRTLATRSLVLAVMLVCCPLAYALDPTLDLNQYAHTAWKVRDGFVPGAISGIVQTPDGYIWLATEFGLLRFDGVRTVPFQPPPNQHLPDNWIFRILAAGDGTLWIGTQKGLASWNEGKLTRYPELDGQYIFSLLEDHEGAIWVGGGAVTTPRLCVIREGRAECTEDTRFGFGIFGLHEDSRRGVWLGLTNSLWRVRPEPRKIVTVPGPPATYNTFLEQADGTLLVGTRNGIQRLVDDRLEPYSIPGGPRQFVVHNMTRDRDGALWIGTSNGLVHVHAGETDAFTNADGLSGDLVNAVVEDREGNIWVATDGGLDRFRNSAVTTLSASQGSWAANIYSVLSSSDGSVWFGSAAGISRWQNGRATAYRARSAAPVTGARVVPSSLESGATSLLEDRRGRIWLASNQQLGYLEKERFVAVRSIPDSNVRSFAEDNAGNIWVASQTAGLIRIAPNGTSQDIPWPRLGHRDFAATIAADPGRGGLWIGFFLGGIAYFAEGEIRESYQAANGLGGGAVYTMRVDGDGAIWVSTESGLSRLKNGGFATLNSRNGLPCDGVHWAIEDDAGSWWLKLPCGLVRVAQAEMASWTAAVEQDRNALPAIRVTQFDNADGVLSRATPSGYSPQHAKSTDGRLWFVPIGGISVLDPRRIPFNNVPAPVHIEQVVADRKAYPIVPGGNQLLTFPPLTRDLAFDYTALSLVAPEKVRFRYMLEGWDRDWQEVGTRRQAFYNNLPPGNYRFRVSATNNSGVWNASGASLDFAVPPAYYQTGWFRSATAVAFLLLIAALYQLRVRQVAHDYNVRLEARVSERTRIARDFHDTLLQSFQGVLLKFHAVTYLLPDRPGEARGKLETIVEQARQAIAEGRDAVQGLRSPLVINDLADAISTLGKELVSGQGDTAPAFVVDVEGTPRDLVPPIRDEIYRIACEALRNAFRHAQAKRIEMEIRYDQRQLQVRVRDDGRGIDTKRAEAVARHGHFGLAGMRERAELAGGTVAIWSEQDSGTEIELTIPASVAYTSSSIARRWLFGKAGATKR